MIKELETREHVYRTADGIYFDTSTFPAYADFGHLDTENLSK
jgi:cysteinyl-tRNA synthetase